MVLGVFLPGNGRFYRTPLQAVSPQVELYVGQQGGRFDERQQHAVAGKTADIPHQQGIG